MKKLTIAIDGHASTGKSSIAKEIAVKYGYRLQQFSVSVQESNDFVFF